MIFPNAFKKVFTPATPGATLTAASGGTNTSALTAGQIGIFDAKTYLAATSGNIGAKPFILAQGSLYASDKIGPVHGGYKESIKSKVINPKYISKYFKVAAKTPLNQIVKIDATGATINSDNTYRLRLDVKGSPALRFLSHNLYKTLDAYSGCDTVTGTTNTVDPVSILLKWKDQITESPILKDFLAPKVWKKAAATTSTASSTTTVIAVTSATGIVAGQKVVGTGVPVGTTVVSIASLNVTVSTAVNIANAAALKFYTEASTATYVAETVAGTIATVDAHLDITTAYVETKFGNATFTVTDKYDVEPLFVYASFVLDAGDPCAVAGITYSVTQDPVQASGVGETVLRDLILSMRYEQNVFHDSMNVNDLRMNEIEGHPALGTISRSGLYDQICLLHNVPRFNNPSSTFDNDQYLLVIAVPTGTTTTSLTAIIDAALTAAGSQVTLETY